MLSVNSMRILINTTVFNSVWSFFFFKLGFYFWNPKLHFSLKICTLLQLSFTSPHPCHTLKPITSEQPKKIWKKKYKGFDKNFTFISVLDELTLKLSEYRELNCNLFLESLLENQTDLHRHLRRPRILPSWRNNC